MLSVANLACARGERPLFSGLAFDLAPGEWLHVQGENGVGKTTLLRQLQQLCGQNAATAVYIDARNIESSPDALMTTLANALGQPGHTQPLQIIGERQTQIGRASCRERV